MIGHIKNPKTGACVMAMKLGQSQALRAKQNEFSVSDPSLALQKPLVHLSQSYSLGNKACSVEAGAASSKASLAMIQL